MKQMDQSLLSELAIALTDHEAENHGSCHYVDLTEGNITFIQEEYMLEEEDITPKVLSTYNNWEKDEIITFLEHDLIRIEPLPSWKSFDIMVNFAESCIESKRIRLLSALNRQHPFSVFRHTVEESGLLQQWYDFKNEVEMNLARQWLIEEGLTIQNGRIIRK